MVQPFGVFMLLPTLLHLFAILEKVIYVVITSAMYRIINPIGRIESSFQEIIALLAALFLLIVIHEAIHGLTSGIFAKGHRNAIAFGVIWEMLTPYCTCAEPLAK